MLLYFSLLFIALPIAEIYLLLEVGDSIGGWNTFFLLLIIAMLGASIAKNQGYRMLHSLQSNLQQGVVPAEDIINGFMIFLGGLLLVVPGFLTDVLGIALLIPFVRKVFVLALRAKIQKAIQAGTVKVQSFGTTGGNFYSTYSSTSSQNPFKEEIRDVSPTPAKVIDIASKRIEKQNHQDMQ